jgi:hypothetical protein
MVKCSVFFEVRYEFLSTIQTNFGFKGLIFSLARMTWHNFSSPGIVSTLIFHIIYYLFCVCVCIYISSIILFVLQKHTKSSEGG